MLPIICLLILLLLGTIVGLSVRHRTATSKEQPPLVASDCTSCTGTNAKCIQECALEAAVKPVEYFDDEELDAFAGRDGNEYKAEEVEQFAYILNTMQPEEVVAWTQSLSQRGINLPDELKDEAIMIMEEQRQ